MRKDRILFIMHYPPPVHGAAMVGQSIKKSKLLNNQYNCKYINLSTSRTVDEIGAAGVLKWLRYGRIVVAVVANLISFRPALLYFTLTASGIGFYKDGLLVLIAKLFGKKVLIHFHNKGVKKRQDSGMDNLLYKLVFRGAKVILLAPELYEDIRKYVPEDHVHYCSNGVPEIDYVPRKQVKDDKVHLLFLSNLIASKGLLILLEACALLRDKGLHFKCSFVGGPGDVSAKDFESAIVKRNLSETAYYLGKKYGADKYEIYANADIFVLPTFYENECFPLVLLEAMQFSLPLVSTKEGGIPDIIEEGITGFMVSPRNAVHLAKKLELLIADEELRTKMGKNAYNKYKSNYTLALFENRFLSILNKELI